MAAYLMRSKDALADHEQADGPVMRGYLWLIRKTTTGRVLFIPARYLTLVSAIGALAVSLFFMVQIPGSFIPPEDVSRISLSIELPPGSTLDDTDRSTQAVARIIEEIDGVENVFVLGGASPTGDRDVRLAAVTVTLEKLDHSLLLKLSQLFGRIPVLGALVPEVENTGRERPQSEIEAEIFEKVQGQPDIRITKLNDRGERDITFSILSTNEADLNEAAARLESALRGDPLLANVATEGALPRPEVQIVPRQAEAARLGVTTAAIAETVRVASIGDFDAALAKVSIDNRQIPVRVEIDGALKSDLEQLRALRVPTASGATVPLASVADVTLSEGPSSIDRLNRERKVTIGANLPVGVALGTATERFKELVDGVELPASVRVAESGDAEIQAELVQSFGNAMIMGLMLVLTVLILLFGSVIQPFTILFSLPLAIGGVAAALILTNNAVSMPVLIGILMLMGIVTKNAILLVDFAIEMRNRGMDRYTAMIEAGHKRARPIVMTSIAMSAGMLPSALGVGEGGSFRAPMATAVIGGIVVSTILSLIVVPAFFLIMDDLQRLLSRLFRGIVGKKDDEAEEPSPAELAENLGALAARVDALESGGRGPAGTLRAAE
jgi:multidrug efflux pump subunit AcrB